MTNDETLLLAVDLVAQAVIHNDDTLKITAAKLLARDPYLPLSFTYAVAEKVRDAHTLTVPDDFLTSNGDTT